MADILPDCMMPDGADPCKGYTALLAENERLLNALIGMAGCDDLSELRGMENALRSLALQEDDKSAMVGALRVLIEVLEGRGE